MRLLYSLIYSMALMFVLPAEYFKRPGPRRGRWLREKFGVLKPEAAGTVWLHAVSVGEVIASERFLKELKQRYPEKRIVVSTITDTGQDIAKKRLGDIARIVYLPLDLGFVLSRAIAALRPELLILVETELWPALIWSMKDAAVPVVVLNGRISDSSFGGYRRIRFIMKRVLSSVGVFLMQDEEYARRIRAIGADEQKVGVMGSFKFDTEPPGEKPAWAGLLSGPVLVAGSTHRGEESLVLDAYQGLRRSFEDLSLIIAPRHPERFDEVEAVLVQKGVPYVRRSRLNETGLRGTVVLLDTMGELGAVYALADVAIMGGSFTPHGGQNLLEPVSCGTPVVCGPHMENFPFVSEFYEAGAAVRSTAEGLAESVGDLLGSETKRRQISQSALGLLRSKAGATERAIQAVERFLK